LRRWIILISADWLPHLITSSRGRLALVWPILIRSSSIGRGRHRTGMDGWRDRSREHRAVGRGDEWQRRSNAVRNDIAPEIGLPPPVRLDRAWWSVARPRGAGQTGRYFVCSRSAVKPMPRRFGVGGFISSRMAEKIVAVAWSCCRYSCTSSSSLRASSALEPRIAMLLGTVPR